MKSVSSGLYFGLAGLCCGFLIFSNAKGAGWEKMIYASALAAFLTGTLVWWILVDRSGSTSIWKGALAGGLTGLLAHPLAWYVGIILNYFSGTKSSLGDEPMNPLTGLWGALVFSLFSWLVVGWLTVLVGGLVGTLIAFARRTS